MSILKKLEPAEAAGLLEAKEIHLVDVREADEYAREHIPGSFSLPLSTLKAEDARLRGHGTPVFLCRSGNRTDVNCDRLAEAASDGFILRGGLDAWRAEGLPTRTEPRAPLEIMRQVQIAAGSLVLLGVALGSLLHPAFYGLAAFVGAGLTFAGVSGWCGMAKLLAFLPWNRRRAA